MKSFAAIAAILVTSVALAAAAEAPTLSGEVLEVKDVEAYTYLRLKTKEGEIWAAVNKSPVKKGAQVTVENAALMMNFESKTLKRKFDKIVFGTLAGAPKTASAGAMGATGAAPTSGSMAAFHSGLPKPADVGDVNVPKATGPDARTVAEIVGNPAKLKDKTVVVRGKVVKYTPEVMGKNWLHLRDGSGSAADGTNDILVTSAEPASIGDVVVAKGMVRTDVNLGSGYSYKVLVDGATLQK